MKTYSAIISDGAYIRLPLTGWYPYDTRTGYKFYLTFTYQILGVTINAFCNISMDTVATGLFIHICCQLDMLKDSLENMKENALKSLRNKKQFNQRDVVISKIDEDTFEYTEQELEKEMGEIFIKCIKHHYAIIGYVRGIIMYSKDVTAKNISVIFNTICKIYFNMEWSRISKLISNHTYFRRTT